MTGTLKGYDQLMNLVMDDVVEEYESERMSSGSTIRADGRQCYAKSDIRTGSAQRPKYRPNQPYRWISR